MEKSTLIIAEKPKSAEKIASALSGDEMKKGKEGKAVWYEFDLNGKPHIVVPAVGHLFGLKQEGKGWKYPILEMKWVPTFEVSKSAAFSKVYYENFIRLAKNIDEVIVACDYDREGDVIGYNITRFICNRDDASRMKFSTLTKSDLIEAYENRQGTIDSLQVEAGLARHQLDWLWGLNATRALTLAYKTATNRFKIMSSGRVQGPTLSILYEKEKEISKFKPQPFWEASAQITINKESLEASYRGGKIWDKKEAESKKGETAQVTEIKKRKVRKKQPTPFDLTTLQTESFNHFKYSPRQTVDIAQKLYEAGYISYPRTSSQKLPDKIGYRQILDKLIKIYGELAENLLAKEELKPREGEKSDPAHPAIYPTTTIPKYKRMGQKERNIYDLIARRFMATFCDVALREQTSVRFDINGEEYSSDGSKILERGWLDYYTYSKSKEQSLPPLTKGESYPCQVSIEEKETLPPPRFTQAGILKEMEKRGIGTKATRAHILQTLYSRGYIDGMSIEVTEIGDAVIKTFEKYCPDIISTELTKEFEEKMEQIVEGKTNREEIVTHAKGIIDKIMNEFKKNETIIGKELSHAIDETLEKMSEIGPCDCGGTIKIINFRGGRFIGCSSYFNCKKCSETKKKCKCECPLCNGVKYKCKCKWKEKGWDPSCETSYPLPHKGKIIKVGKDCEYGHPMLRIIRQEKRPWIMCIDPECPTKDYEKKDDKKDGKKTKKKNASKAKKASEDTKD